MTLISKNKTTILTEDAVSCMVYTERITGLKILGSRRGRKVIVFQIVIFEIR